MNGRRGFFFFRLYGRSLFLYIYCYSHIRFFRSLIYGYVLIVLLLKKLFSESLFFRSRLVLLMTLLPSLPCAPMF